MPDADLSPELTPHEGQQAVLDSDARTRVVVKGRQWGGSTLIALDVVEKAIKEPGLEAWVFAPSIRSVKIVWEYVVDMLPPEVTTNLPREVEIRNGSVIKFFSAEQPPKPSNDEEDLPEYVAIDEADHIRKGEYHGVASVAGLENADWRLFVGTPFGYAEETDEYPGSWLHDHFTDGLKSGTDTESWRFPTASNPLINGERLAEQSEMVDDETAEQEFGGCWK